jgi:hypothetical protein
MDGGADFRDGLGFGRYNFCERNFHFCDVEIIFTKQINSIS